MSFNTAKKLQAAEIITIYGHGGDLVQKAFAHENIKWVEQAEQLGTGHAVKVTLPVLAKTGCSLILSGDVPCITEVLYKNFSMHLLKQVLA